MTRYLSPIREENSSASSDRGDSLKNSFLSGDRANSVASSEKSTAEMSHFSYDFVSNHSSYSSNFSNEARSEHSFDEIGSIGSIDEMKSGDNLDEILSNHSFDRSSQGDFYYEMPINKSVKNDSINSRKEFVVFEKGSLLSLIFNGFGTKREVVNSSKNQASHQDKPASSFNPRKPSRDTSLLGFILGGLSKIR